MFFGAHDERLSDGFLAFPTCVLEDSPALEASQSLESSDFSEGPTCSAQKIKNHSWIGQVVSWKKLFEGNNQGNPFSAVSTDWTVSWVSKVKLGFFSTAVTFQVDIGSVHYQVLGVPRK